MRKRKGRLCRHPKRKPYGTTGTDPYCRPHDICSPYVVSKKAIRFRARMEIRGELESTRSASTNL